MRRKPGTLLGIEVDLLQAAIDLRADGHREFYGYLIASAMKDRASRSLTAHGTLYKALDRMEKAGLIKSRWEDPQIAASEERPRRRLYEVTAAGEAAMMAAVATLPGGPAPLREGLVPT
jgi:DNA-binding MarR family transcriptional regulator